MSTAISVSQELADSARAYALANDRSMAKQIEYWAKIGRTAEDNPDLPFSFIKSVFLGRSQIKEGLGLPLDLNDL